MGEKQAAKQRRREKREEREREKAERKGDSPAQDAEAIRRANAEDPEEAEQRRGTEGYVGGDTAQGRPGSS